ncbi:hypothetical protein HDV01_000781, partial [Terramyces sp. JEL0728]
EETVQETVVEETVQETVVEETVEETVQETVVEETVQEAVVEEAVQETVLTKLLKKKTVVKKLFKKLLKNCIDCILTVTEEYVEETVEETVVEETVTETVVEEAVQETVALETTKVEVREAVLENTVKVQNDGNIFADLDIEVVESKAKTEPSNITKPPTALLNTSTKDVIQEAEPRKSTASWRRKSQSNLDKGKKKGGKCTIL